ncbi:MAG: DNA-binding response regulator, partial [Firmicutes bacterium HGW-Firmicutes-5]
MFKILLIEDDKKISDIVVENLVKAGYDSLAVTDFSDVLPEFMAFKPDLVLLDIILPFYDGYYWCGQIRLLSKVPIIFISSKSTDMDIIIATNMGGDDYLVKPFSIDILLAKVAGLLRRAYSYDNTEMDIISHEGLIFNIGSGVVS